jgi:isochorismate pyruvate lyase
LLVDSIDLHLGHKKVFHELATHGVCARIVGHMRDPDECSDMTEIRAEIDRLDREVIGLIGQRFKYVKAAAKFKTSAAAVAAPKRFAAMLDQRRAWAVEVGLSPEAIEKLYRDLVTHFIEEELKFWDQSTKKPPRAKPN